MIILLVFGCDQSKYLFKHVFFFKTFDFFSKKSRFQNVCRKKNNIHYNKVIMELNIKKMMNSFFFGKFDFRLVHTNRFGMKKKTRKKNRSKKICLKQKWNHLQQLKKKTVNNLLFKDHITFTFEIFCLSVIQSLCRSHTAKIVDIKSWFNEFESHL